MRTAGPEYLGNNRCRFTVWAPEKNTISIQLEQKTYAMQKDRMGYFSITLENAGPGSRYLYLPEEGLKLPDPASAFQPEGVHGPSDVVDHQAFRWDDGNWKGIPFRDLIIYEIHTGTFTQEGSFEGIISKLDHLLQLGVNAIELMPVCQFPGERNWGYDGVLPFAVQNSYGGPAGLKKLVNACHQKGIAVFLDVVYNHLGPEGNYLQKFGPYFTDKYHTPWGDALNFDREWSDGVREYFASNILYWFEVYHIDGLRVDAIHEIYDLSAVHFWEFCYEELRQLEQKLGRSLYLVAESDLNTPRVVKSPENGGFGFTAQWLDDFHHALYVMLDKAGSDRYADYRSMEQLAKAYTEGFVLSGEYVEFRKRRFGRSSAGIPGDRFIIFNQNHDQIGNRVNGERLSVLVDFERLKIAAAALLLAPYIPMLFMGEEYGDESPFYYFVSHSDPELIQAVRQGRKKEFEHFNKGEEAADPQDENTFLSSKLQWNKACEGWHLLLLNWYKELILLRRSDSIFQNYDKDSISCDVIGGEGFVLHRRDKAGLSHLLCIFNLSDSPLAYTLPHLLDSWTQVLNSKEARWMPDAAAGTGDHQVQKAGTELKVPSLGVLVYSASADKQINKT